MATFMPIMDYNIDPYRNRYPRTELEAMVRKLSKRANARLLRLERSRSNITGELYSSFGAYQQYAVPALEGRKRFKESGYKDWSYDQLTRKLVQLQGFLSAKTSTVLGQRQFEQKRVSTFASGKWGQAARVEGLENMSITAATNKEFYDFLNSKEFSDLRSVGFSSDQIVEFYESMYQGGLDDDEIASRISHAYTRWMAEKDAGLAEFQDFLSRPPIE